MVSDLVTLFDWIDNLKMDGKKKKVLVEVVVCTTLGVLWRYMNDIVNEAGVIKKSDIFYFIREISFYWFNNRQKRGSLNWTSWIQNPLNFFLTTEIAIVLPIDKLSIKTRAEDSHEGHGVLPKPSALAIMTSFINVRYLGSQIKGVPLKCLKALYFRSSKDLKINLTGIPVPQWGWGWSRIFITRWVWGGYGDVDRVSGMWMGIVIPGIPVPVAIPTPFPVSLRKSGKDHWQNKRKVAVSLMRIIEKRFPSQDVSLSERFITLYLLLKYGNEENMFPPVNESVRKREKRNNEIACRMKDSKIQLHYTMKIQMHYTWFRYVQNEGFEPPSKLEKSKIWIAQSTTSHCMIKFHDEEETISTNNWMLSSDVPPSATASRAALFNSAPFFLDSTDLGPLKISSTHRATSSPSKIPSRFLLNFTPMPQISVTSFAFVGWSVHCGQTINGTPAVTVSVSEFHPP
ncbi:hypothetical protein LXL04_001564 [Taraxacum kok-saghyz]